MYRSKLFLTMISFLVLISCENKDNEDDDMVMDQIEACTNIESATGILLSDEQGSLLGDIGQAYTLNYDLFNNNTGVGLFPNPCNDVLSIIYEDEKVEAVIIPAKKVTDCLATDLNISAVNFSKADITQSSSNITFNLGNGGNILINIDVSSLVEGYYNLLLISPDTDQVISRTTFYINRTLMGDDTYFFLAEGWE